MAGITTSTITKIKKVPELKMTKIKAYIYPISKRHKTGIYNPYIDHFIKYGEENYAFVNKHHPSGIGLFHILKHINEIEILFLNWVERLPELKAGVLQMFLLYLLIPYCKMKKIKVVWTMHNNIAHSNKYFRLKKILFNKMIRESDMIITHSREGISIVKEKIRHSQNVFYFPHPVIDQLNFATTRQEYDILIWGSLVSYKGVHHFLEFLKERNLDHKYTIKIIGKCQDTNYYNLLKNYANERVKIHNMILPDNDLKDEMRKARIVLFTYSGDSVLSSGALAETISNGALVIGPYKAAFKDLADLNYILCYDSFYTLIPLLDKVLSGELIIPRFRFSNYLKDFHWVEFSKKMHQKLYQDSHAKVIF